VRNVVGGLGSFRERSPDVNEELEHFSSGVRISAKLTKGLNLNDELISRMTSPKKQISHEELRLRAKLKHLVNL